MLDICNPWPWIKAQGVFYFGGGSDPPPIIIPPPPPPPPVIPDIGSAQRLEAEREKLASQIRTGRTSTKLTGADEELRGGRSGLGGEDPNALPPPIGGALLPPYTGGLLGNLRPGS